MRVAAVVVNWNGGEQNLECLRSLAAQGPQVGEVIFVDNGSGDGSPDRVRGEFPRVRLVLNEENRGFGGGANQGIELALELGADAVLLLNNDATLPRGALALLVAALERHPEAGVVGPRVLHRHMPRRIWAAGGNLTYRQNLTTLLGHGAPDDPRWQRTVRVSYVPGCAMLVRREVFERIGLFDADYFMYTEDVDFCLRAERAGIASLCVGECAAYHAASTSTGGGYNPRRKYMMGVNSIWFLRRYARPLEWARFFAFDVLTLPAAWLAGLCTGRGKAVAAKAAGIVDGLRGRRVSAEVVSKRRLWLW